MCKAKLETPLGLTTNIMVIEAKSMQIDINSSKNEQALNFSSALTFL